VAGLRKTECYGVELIVVDRIAWLLEAVRVLRFWPAGPHLGVFTKKKENAGVIVILIGLSWEAHSRVLDFSV
jgi:hypothetical protein